MKHKDKHHYIVREPVHGLSSAELATIRAITNIRAELEKAIRECGEATTDYERGYGQGLRTALYAVMKYSEDEFAF